MRKAMEDLHSADCLDLKAAALSKQISRLGSISDNQDSNY